MFTRYPFTYAARRVGRPEQRKDHWRDYLQPAAALGRLLPSHDPALAREEALPPPRGVALTVILFTEALD